MCYKKKLNVGSGIFYLLLKHVYLKGKNSIKQWTRQTWLETDETDLGPWKCPSGVETTLSSAGLWVGGWWWGGGGWGESVGIVGSGGGTEAGWGTEWGLGSGEGATEGGEPTDGTGKESFCWWWGVDCWP